MNCDDTDNGVEELKDNTSRPARKTQIEYQLLDGTRTQAQVLWSQPKATSTYKNWLNVRKVGDSEDMSVDWNDVVWWRVAENEHVLAVQMIKEGDTVVEKAKEKEINNLIDNDVFEWISYNGQEKIVSSKWVITEKTDDNGNTTSKARLVARGFEEMLLSSDVCTDSPTCTKQSLR